MNKKELKETYKQTKPEMGVYVYKCMPTGKAYIGYGKNIKGEMNSITFRLNLGSFNAKAKCNLQNDWNEYGVENFEIEILEKLDYDKDETKTDYKEDLRVLREICSEKFTAFEFIQE